MCRINRILRKGCFLFLILFISGCGGGGTSNSVYTLFINTEGNGVIEPASGQKFPAGALVTLTVIADEGWQFNGWAGPDAGQIINNQLVMERDMVITARFIPTDDEINLTATISSSHAVGTTPLKVNYSVTTSASGDFTFNWNLGDGTVKIGESSLAHTYAIPGRYLVSVEVLQDSRVVANDQMDLKVWGMIGQSLSTPGVSVGLDIEGDYAYVIDQMSLSIVDISQPTKIVLRGRLWHDNLTDVAVGGDYAYVVEKNVGLHVVDVSQKNRPQIIKTLEFHGITSVVVEDTVLYVACSSFGDWRVQLYDVTNPRTPTFITNYRWVDKPSNLVVKDNVLCILDGYRLAVVDFNYDSSHPISGTYWSDYTVNDTALHDETAYLVTDHGLHIIDISNPSDPVRVSFFPESGREIFVQGKYAYVTGNSSLRIIDISNPNDLQVVGRVGVSGSDIFVKDDFAYWTSGGLEVVFVGQ